ncbi:hypothetical protein INR49_013938 [Caranx melampygus]|nr:hypothetical protein INR49_013938 [Caranx melampygus]
MAMSLLWLHYLYVTLIFLLLHVGDCFQGEPNLCDSSCAGFPTADLSFQRGVRYTYRYSTTITTILHGSNAGRNGLALDCVVDIDVVSKCHLMMQIRNPQIKRLSPQKEHSVQRLKSLRESLERTRLKFSLQGGKVTALCLQEGEQVWALNIKRALLSMLQTSRTAAKQETEKETDVYGTCTSRYERRGPVLLKTRDLKQCQESRMENFWPHSVALTEDTSLQSELHCIQRHGSTVMEEVNCTEDVSMVTWSRSAGSVRTRTMSTLLLLRAQPGNPLGADSLSQGVLTSLQFEEEGAARPGKSRGSFLQQASHTVRLLCSLTSDPQRVSQEFLQLAFQLRRLTLSQLKTLWQEASFKCRNDWTKELEEEQAHSFLTTIALIPHPSPQIISSINALLDVPEVWSKALLAGSSLVYQLCQRSQTSCSEFPPIQTFMQTLEETLREGCEGEEPTRRSVLLQLYRSSQEDPEVRIAAYQQLMRCPDQNVFQVVKATLRNETSSQVGSFVWSHLTNVLRSEDPMKQALIESLPDDIISRDFEAEFLKYSSYSDHTVASGMGITNLETSLIFSPKSFLPRSATANLTVYFHGRATNLMEVDLHVENAEPFLKSIFGHSFDGESTDPNQKPERRSSARKTDDRNRAEKEKCLSSTNSFLKQARAMLFGGRKMEENGPKCWAGVKVFGNELSVFTCEDLHNRINQLSLNMAGLAVKLLKGHEVQLNHRAVLMTEELLLPSLSGLPVKLGINMTSLISLHLKGNINYRDTSHFSLTGYIKPNAYVSLSVRMGVDGALGQAAVDWVSELRSSTSLDGSVQLEEGRDVRVTLNTPEDVMDIISLSSRVFQLSGDHREEIKGPKSRMQTTTCTPKTWSKMVGWQLCSNTSHPLSGEGISLPPSRPIHLSLRLLKLDRGLHYYLLEAAYSLLPQKGTWLPREASIHLLLATPQSSIPRDMSLDLAYSPQRLLLRITHPLKTIHIQGQLEQERNIKSGKLDLMIDGDQYYILGLVDTHTLLSEQRTRYHLEAKMAADGHPMILSANVTRGLGRKTSFSATVKNVFRETASLSVALERRRDSSSRQYSVEAELLLPGVVGSRMLGLMEQRGSLWSSAVRLKYGLGGDARQLRQECYASQRLKSERDSNLTYIMRADHEFYCSNTAPINHKIQLRHEESPSHIKSSLDMSYGKHWDEINNKRTLLLSQSFKNQSTQNNTSYTLEVPEKNVNYRTQLLHSHLRLLGSESSTHLKIIYNNLMPLVAGLHWKSPPTDSLQKKWEGTFNMDTPWLYVYTTHKLSHLQRHTLQLTSELTASKWLTTRNLVLEGFYRDRGREREARLELYTPAVTYLQAAGWGVMMKRGVKASCSLSSLWTPPLRGDVSLEASKFSHTLQMASAYGKHNISLSAAMNSVDKNLKKRQAIVKMSISGPKSPSTELEFEGAVEELRKDKKMYQKTAVLHLRQPFQTFPQTLLLRETFTIDLLNDLYILESKAGLHGNREVVHTLTLGYQPPSPFVCSALVHPFSSETIPSDSEICVTVTSNQLQLPSSALMEGDVCWDPKNNSDFDYQARGKLRVERQECQLNGTSGRVGLYSSVSHPFKSKIPKTLEVKATGDISSVSGQGSSSVRVRADGKDRVRLDVQMSQSLQREHRAVGLRMNLSQSLLPTATDLHVNMAANMTSDSVSLHGLYTQGDERLLAQVKGSLKNTHHLQLAVSGDLRHSMANLALLPPAMGLDGTLGQSDTLIEGQLRVRVQDTLYSVELKHQEEPGEALDSEDEESMMGKKSHDWLFVRLGEENFFVNVSRRLEGKGRGEVYTQLSHSFHLLNATGVPANSSAQVMWAQDGSRLSLLAQLQAGPEHLKAEYNGGKSDHLLPRWEYFLGLQHQVKALMQRGLSSSIQAKAHYQMNCTGDATADRLSAQCYGNVAGRPVETLPPLQNSVNISISRSGCSTDLSAVLQVAGEQRGSLTLYLTCVPGLSLKTSVQHSIEEIQMLGIPSHGTLILNIMNAHLPGVEFDLELGPCYFRGKWGEAKETEGNQSFYAVNMTNYCLALQGTVLPVTLDIQGLLSVSPCQFSVMSSIRADNQDLTLDLVQSCRPRHISGTLAHSFSWLRSRGLPQVMSIEATAPGGTEQSGALSIKAGTCHIRANKVTGAKGRAQWLWALESQCPVLQSHLNGSVWQDTEGTWTATVDTDLVGKRGFLRLNARTWPELSVDGVGWSHRVQASGLVAVTSTLAESQVSMVIDDAELKALLALKKTKDINEASLHLNHSVPVLKRLGLPANAAVTLNSGSHGNGSRFYIFNSNAGKQRVQLGSSEGKAFTLLSQSGGQQAGLRLKLKCFPMTKEISGSMWHSWSWLQDRGLPLNMEGLCFIRGVLSQLQSRAQLTVDGDKLLASGFNISVADGRLAMQLSYSPPTSNRTDARFSLDTALTAQFKGPLRSASVDVHCQDWRVQVVGDVGTWRSQRGSKEARVTLRHTVQGQTSPVLQLEAWGRLTESQLRCSMAVNPELSSSLALIVQGHHLPHSKDLMVKVVQNIPKMLVYLPSQLNVRSQLNQSQSRVSGFLEVLSGRRRLWALGELAAIESGYRQAVELKHSYPQLKPLPRAVAVMTVYEARNWSYQVQHGAVWGNQEFSLSGLYSAPPGLQMGNQTLKVQINCIPRWTSLEVTLERSLLGRLDSVLLGWTRHGRLEQVRALSSWSQSEEMNETKLELKQPFSSTLSRLTLHTHSSQREQHSSHQMAVSSVKGCVSVGQEGNLYSQNAELRWDNRSIKQSMKYQKGQRGMHSLQLNVGLDKVSPAPCPSHTLLAKVQTNLRDHLEHTVQLGLCPPQPALSWSGFHRVNSGEELFHTLSRLSVTGHSHQCSLSLTLTNSSTAQGTNMSLFSESQIGNWSVEVGASALSWPRGTGLHVQARLDRKEKMWLNGTIEEQCLKTTAGYANGPGLGEDLTLVACVDENRSLMVDVHRQDSSSISGSLASVSVGTANQRLTLRASGCSESLTAVEARIDYLSSQIQIKLLEKLKTLQHLLAEFRRQSRDNELLQELSAVPLHASQRLEALLRQRDRGLLSLWQGSRLRRAVTDSLPRLLSLLQHASLLGQQELRRPLATLAGVYQDVNGRQLEAVWREVVLLWTDRLVEVVPALLGNPQLRPLVRTSITSLSVAMDVAGQHTYHWVETRLATALSGLRKRLASVYKFSPSGCSVTVSVQLPPLPRSRVVEAGLVEILLEEWLLRPLQTLASIRPMAELYRLKRKIMDSPFRYQALLVEDQFVVTFDGHLYELPGSCSLLLAQDVSPNPLFTLLLSSGLLLIELNDTTIHIQHNGQVKADCNNAVAHTFHNDNGVALQRGSNLVQVSSQNGVSVSCDLSLDVCSFTLDGWLHGASTGLFGTNDNEAGNDFPLPDGSQAENLDSFFHNWQMKPECSRRPAAAATSPVSCDYLFSSPDSPLSSCFRVVDPAQFLSVCESSSSRAPCRLASAFVLLCQQNYIPLKVPFQCLQTLKILVTDFSATTVTNPHNQKSVLQGFEICSRLRVIKNDFIVLQQLQPFRVKFTTGWIQSTPVSTTEICPEGVHCDDEGASVCLKLKHTQNNFSQTSLIYDLRLHFIQVGLRYSILEKLSCTKSMTAVCPPGWLSRVQLGCERCPPLPFGRRLPVGDNVGGALPHLSVSGPQ